MAILKWSFIKLGECEGLEMDDLYGCYGLLFLYCINLLLAWLKLRLKMRKCTHANILTTTKE